jgi:nucleoside-diphosphate-sugar epimerase
MTTSLTQILRWSTISDRILILGAGRLARSLVKRLPVGHEVALGRRSFFKEGWSGVTTFSTFGEPERLRLILKSFRPKVVVICWAPSKGGDHHETYVGGMKSFLEAVAEGAELEQVVYTSSSAVVEGGGGDWVSGDGSLPIPEGDRAKNLWEAEERLRSWGEKSKIPTLTLRLSGLYGNGVIPGKRLIEKGGPIGKSADGWVNLVHIDDAAGAALIGIDQRIEGQWVVSSGPVQREKLYGATAASLGLPEPKWSQLSGDLGKRLKVSGYEALSGFDSEWKSPLEWVISQKKVL